jgi:hypothetical protein
MAVKPKDSSTDPQRADCILPDCTLDIQYTANRDEREELCSRREFQCEYKSNLAPSWQHPLIIQCRVPDVAVRNAAAGRPLGYRGSQDCLGSEFSTLQACFENSFVKNVDVAPITE